MTQLNNGFLILNKAWFGENEFFKSLSHAEFKIMLYLLASVLRLDKREQRSKKSLFLARLFRDRNLLVASVSQRTIAVRCYVNRGTVQSALRKLEEMGAVIFLPCEEQGFYNNVYFLGFRGPTDLENRSLFMVDSGFLKDGRPIPDSIKHYIQNRFLIDERPDLAKSKDGIYLLETLFGVKPSPTLGE
jgi:DNA-binding MarR family transcriptional regulator